LPRIDEALNETSDLPHVPQALAVILPSRD
jgi:hypothetical protein